MKCDIIMPVWDELEYTRSSINSIVSNTKYPFRLIIIDNASEQKTQSYLNSLLQQKGLEIKLIRNEKNIGFVKAINQGLRVSNAPYICILNNDIIVTDGWLAEMIEVLESDPNIGLVNPSSNNLGQHPHSQNISEYAKALKVFKGQFIEMGACLGFSMLFKREIFDKVGFFDEIYGVGNFEDTEYSRKVESLGLSCVRAKASYVYHRISKSFLKKKDFEEIFKRNQDIFYRRWGRPKRLLYIMTKEHQKLYDWIKAESIKRARFGDWVWLFLRQDLPIKIKDHSNIRIFTLPNFLFKENCMFRILKRKKKFDSIYVDEDMFRQTLDALKRFHSADIMLMGG